MKTLVWQNDYSDRRRINGAEQNAQIVCLGCSIVKCVHTHTHTYTMGKFYNPLCATIIIIIIISRRRREGVYGAINPIST